MSEVNVTQELPSITPVLLPTACAQAAHACRYQQRVPSPIHHHPHAQRSHEPSANAPPGQGQAHEKDGDTPCHCGELWLEDPIAVAYLVKQADREAEFGDGGCRGLKPCVHYVNYFGRYVRNYWRGDATKASNKQLGCQSTQTENSG